ncbi:MAG: response regulator [Candidatus Scalinduaceae bacterium]
MKEKIILLIEDDQDHADVITNVLKEDDVKDIKTEVIVKKDGQEAIDYLQYEMQSQPSAVILDLNLPKIDGMDVLKFIKGNSKYRSIPVIIFSASSDQKTIVEAYNNKANAYFIKFASYDGFVEEVKTLKKYC